MTAEDTRLGDGPWWMSRTAGTGTLISTVTRMSYEGKGGVWGALNKVANLIGAGECVTSKLKPEKLNRESEASGKGGEGRRI